MKRFTSLMLMLLVAVTTWAGPTDLPTLTTDEANPVWYQTGFASSVVKVGKSVGPAHVVTATSSINIKDVNLFIFQLV